MKLLFVLSVMTVSVYATSTAMAASQRAELRTKTDALISNTWYMQRVIGMKLTRTSRSYRYQKSVPYLHWVTRHWQKINQHVRQAFHNPPHFGALVCIHGYEGAWNSNTGNGYYGGLQQDLGFQRKYAPWLVQHKGTADNWTPLEQIWTAEKAVQTRGFWPWPNTARLCGLL